MLGAFDIRYLPRTTVKGQILANLVVEFTEELDQPDSQEVGMPKKGVRVNTISSQQTWELFVDRAANQKGSKIEIVIIFLERITLKKSLRLSFSTTNNEAEYEALQARLNAVKKLERKSVKGHCNSRLVVGQVHGEFEAKDVRMQWYLNQVKRLQADFESFNLEQVPWSKNSHANSLATLAT